MNEVYAFDFKFDESSLLEEWNEYYSYAAKAYVDPRYEEWMKDPEMVAKYGNWDQNSWRIAKGEHTTYSDYLCKYFDIEAEPRFYILEGGSILPPHIDLGTQCAINFLLGDDDTLAPVSFSSGNSYSYKTALLNTSIEHGVTNGPNDRIIFKLSIMNEPFESVKQKIQTKLG